MMFPSAIQLKLLAKVKNLAVNPIDFICVLFKIITEMIFVLSNLLLEL